MEEAQENDIGGLSKKERKKENSKKIVRSAEREY